MISILDGPCAGAILALRSAPHFLRVTRTPDGRVDALDQPNDRPNDDEALHVYVAVTDGPHGSVYICGRGKGAASGRFAIANYKHLPLDPVDVPRYRGAWIDWVTAHGNDAAIAAGLDPWVAPASA